VFPKLSYPGPTSVNLKLATLVWFINLSFGPVSGPV